MKLGPFTLTHEKPPVVIDTLHKMLEVDLPWQMVDGLRIQCRDDVNGARYWPALHIIVMPSTSGGWGSLAYLAAHETGHALDVRVFGPQHRIEAATILHGGPCPDEWYLSGAGFHRMAAAEAFADYIAWRCGQNSRTSYGPHAWDGVRADRLADLIRAATQKEPAMPTFSDVTETHPHYTGIEWAAAQGLVQGYPDGTFRPSEPVTRAQLATILMGQEATSEPVDRP